MTDEEAQGLRRENAYLKVRCAQLQDDVTNLGAEVRRLQRHSPPSVALSCVGPSLPSGGR